MYFPFQSRVCAPFAAIAVLLATSLAPAQEKHYFNVIPSQSVVQLAASIQIPSIGLVVETIGQGSGGLGTPWFGDGTTGQLGGLLAADVDWSSNTLVFGGGSLYGIPTGLWEPAPLGIDGVAPAFVGALIEDLFGAPTVAVAAVRNFMLDYSNAYSVTNLQPAGGGFEFATDHWVSVAAQVDLYGKSGIAALLGADRIELSDVYAARNWGQVGQLSPVGSGWQVSIPIDTAVFIQTGEVEGLGPINVSLEITGQIVGHSIATLPEVPVIHSMSGNDSLLTAQAIDGEFNRLFHPDIGNRVLNTSKAIQHATILGIGDGSLDFFSFDVAEPFSLAIFDIDGATFDSQLALYDSAGNLLAWNDDAPSSYGAGGSSSSLDAFLEFTFVEPGRYFIAVGSYAGTVGSLAGIPIGEMYTLHVSVVPEPSTALLFALGLGTVAISARRRRRGVMALLLVLLLPVSAWGNPLIKDSIEAVYDAGGTYPMGYRLFTPKVMESGTDSFPLVLFLHGAGERGNDNYHQVGTHVSGLIQATQGDEYSAFLLAPQMTNFPLAGGWNANSSFDRTIEILNQVIQDYPVDVNRIYLTGLSMGGFGTFHYLAQFPELFAAAVPMSGGGSTSTAPLIKDVPTWVFHGALDDVVSVNQSRNMVQALIDAGGSPLYTELPLGDHGIWGPIYNDAQLQQYGLYDWMFAQSRGQTLVVPEPATCGLMLAGVVALLALRGMRRGRAHVRS